MMFQNSPSHSQELKQSKKEKKLSEKKKKKKQHSKKKAGKNSVAKEPWHEMMLHDILI